MTPGDNANKPATGGTQLTAEEAQRRIEEIVERRDNEESSKRARRTRTILIVVLILLLLLLCGIAAFLYRFLSPAPDAGEDETAGITWIRSIYGYGPAPEQQFKNPNDAETGPDGTIWVADPGNSRVIGFRGDGTYVRMIQGSLNTGEPFRIPSRLAVDPDGILYLVDKANDTLTIMDGNTRLAQQAIPGITAVDADANIVAVGSEAGFAILDKDGNVQRIVGTRGTGEDQFDTVGGIVIDSENETIYIADTYNNRLSAWSVAGDNKWVVQLGNPGNDVKLEGGMSLETSSAAPAGLQLPTDVTVDGLGRPMVLDAFDFTISSFDPKDGKFIRKWGTYGDKDGQFLYPSGFDYDPTKDWFTVADTQNLRAQIIRIDGTGTAGTAGAMSWLNRLLAGPARALWPCAVLIPLLLVLVLLMRRHRRRKAAVAEGPRG